MSNDNDNTISSPERVVLTEGPRVGEWACSENGEHYGSTYATAEEALAEAAYEYEGDTCYVGQVGRVAGAAEAIHWALLDEGDLFDRAEEYFGEEMGAEDNVLDGVDDNARASLMTMLEAAIDAWLASLPRNVRAPTYYTIDPATVCVVEVPLPPGQRFVTERT